MTQLPLFADCPVEPSRIVPASRRTDPSTSAIAAAAYTGSASSDRGLILAELRRHNRQTAGELAQSIGWGSDNVRVSRRLPELERQGLVRKSNCRVCAVKGTLMTEWVVK